MTLLDHFFEDNEENHKEDLEVMASKLYVMGNDTGCRAHLFKLNEGAPGDGVAALSYNRMRLYCLRYDSSCIFIGSGGYKPPDINANQEDTFLNWKYDLKKKTLVKPDENHNQH